MAASNYIEIYITQANNERKKVKKAEESWLENFFSAFSRELGRRNKAASSGDRTVISGAFSVAFKELIPEGLELVKEPLLKDYIELPENENLKALLSGKKADFAIRNNSKDAAILIEFKTNVQFNDVAAAMVEMMAVKKFRSFAKLKTASLHLFPYKTNVAGLRSLNDAFGNPLDHFWVFCTPDQKFDINAIQAFRDEVSNILNI